MPDGAHVRRGSRNTTMAARASMLPHIPFLGALDRIEGLWSIKPASPEISISRLNTPSATRCRPRRST